MILSSFSPRLILKKQHKLLTEVDLIVMHKLVSMLRDLLLKIVSTTNLKTDYSTLSEEEQLLVIL